MHRRRFSFSAPADVRKGAQAPRKTKEARCEDGDMRSLINMGVAASMVVCGMSLCAAETFSKANADAARAAAERGDPAAQFQMGLFYMNGIGVDRDEDKAVEWLEKAAAQNHAQAQYNLGIYYAKFSDREAQRLAVKWLKEAVKEDHADAQFNLAQRYLNPHHLASREQGAGRRAIALLTRAAAQGHAGAKAKLKELGCAIP